MFKWLRDNFPLIIGALCLVGMITLELLPSNSEPNDTDDHSVRISASELEEYWSYEDKYWELDRENEDLRTENEALKEELEHAEKLLWEYEDGYDFLMEAVVITSDDVYGPYHRYGCTEIDWSYYWVFNIEYAQFLGLPPCPYCM